jgi:subtilisin family serine protease
MQVARMALARSVVDTDDDLAGLSIVTVTGKPVSKRILDRISSARSVEFIEPLPTRWLSATGADPMRNQQWGLRAINWFQASRPQSADVTVGVMDTGVDTGHPDLKRIGIDYDHDGTKAADLIGHGTHVTGTIAAIANNDIGIAGVAPCRVALWKIFDDKPDDDDQFYVNTVRYYRALGAASKKGISVLNLSIGGTRRDQTEETLIGVLIKAGVTVCAAMGNEYEEGNPREYPGAFSNVVAVGAVSQVLKRASFSNTGRHINIAAPGVDILSTLPRRKSRWLDETDYAAWSGTSMATPHVSAAAALVGAKNPSFGPAQVARRLQARAKKIPAMKGSSRTSEFGSGLLDLDRALS